MTGEKAQNLHQASHFAAMQANGAIQILDKNSSQEMGQDSIAIENNSHNQPSAQFGADEAQAANEAY